MLLAEPGEPGGQRSADTIEFGTQFFGLVDADETDPLFAQEGEPLGAKVDEAAKGRAERARFFFLLEPPEKLWPEAAPGVGVEAFGHLAGQRQTVLRREKKSGDFKFFPGYFHEVLEAWGFVIRHRQQLKNRDAGVLLRLSRRWGNRR